MPADAATTENGGLWPYLVRQRIEVGLLAGMVSIYFFSFFQRVAVPGTVFDELQHEFRASAGAIAWLGAIYLYLYGGLQLVAGILCDRWDARRVVLGGGLLMAVGSLLFPLSPSLPWLYASRIFVGLGASLIYISVVKAVDELFAPEHFAHWLSVAVFLGYCGGLAGTLPFERAVRLLGWRQALIAVGVLCALSFAATACLFRRFPHRRPVISGVHLPWLKAVALALRNRDAFVLLVTGPLSFGVYFLVQATIGKKLLADFCGMSSGGAAYFTFLMMAACMLSVLASGPLSHALGDRRVPVILLARTFTVTGLVVLLLACRYHWSGTWFLAGYVLLALSSVSGPVGSALLKEVSPPAIMGTAQGVVNGCCYLAVAVFVNLAGVVLDRFEGKAIRTETAVLYPREAYQTIFLICLVVAVASLLLTFTMRESHGHSLHAAPKP